MPDDKKDEKKETPATTVTDADLDAAIIADDIETEPVKEEVKVPEPPAAEPAKEPEKVEAPPGKVEPEISEEPEEEKVEPEEPPKKKLPEDHEERSKLGRKLAKIEQNFEQFVRRFEEIAGRLDRREPEPQASEDDDEPIVLTKRELRKEIEQYEQNKFQKTNKYNQSYIKTVDKYGQVHDDKKHHDAVLKEMTAMVEARTAIYSGDPIRDARENYLLAENSLLRKKASKPVEPKVPLKEEKPKAPLGGPSETVTPPKKSQVIELDEYAADFVKRTGMKQESVESALKGEGPSYLRGKI